VTASLTLALCGLSAFLAHPLRLLAGRLARALRRSIRGHPAILPPSGGVGDSGAWEVAGPGVGMGRPILVTVEVRGKRMKGRGR
jgi:hypothetical protein